MRLEYQLTTADLREGLRLHKPDLGPTRVVGILACLTLIGLGGLLHLVPGPPAAIADLRMYSSVSLWLGTALLLMILTQTWTLQSGLRRRAACEERTQVIVGEDGLHAEARGARSTIEWKRICRFRESSGHFLLYHTPEQYFILPKRAFVAEEEVAAFREMALRLARPG
jgi:YcxB-like protein